MHGLFHEGLDITHGLFLIIHHAHTTRNTFTRTITVKDKTFYYTYNSFEGHDEHFVIRDINDNTYQVSYFVWTNTEINKTYIVNCYNYLDLYDYIYKITEK